MAEVRSALIARLKAYSNLTALVSSRIHSDIRPQDEALPSVTIVKYPGEKFRTASGSRLSIVRARFQLNAWGATKTSAREVFEQVEAALDEQAGTWASTIIHQVLVEDDEDNYETDTKLWRTFAEAIVWWKKA